ncbi:MAG: ABC transporter permease [Proteobacteria bacterium]|nr:ABC transporter permease [Pseudomonadota bacterium]
MKDSPGIVGRYWERGVLAKVGLVIVLFVLLVTIFGPLVVEHDPIVQDLAAVLQPPDREHLLGTDDIGRDIFSRIVHGASTTLGISVGSIALATFFGVLIGLPSGYFRGATDRILSAVMDALLAFPALVLAMAITAALGQGNFSITIAIGIVYTSHIGRLVRGLVLSVRENEYVLAAKSLGSSDLKIMFSHVLPNILAPVIVQATIGLVFAILAEATLSFLGLGAPPPAPSWGTMVREGANFMMVIPLMILAPGAAIFFTVLGVNFVGDAIRDVLDPTQQKAFK